MGRSQNTGDKVCREITLTSGFCDLSSLPKELHLYLLFVQNTLNILVVEQEGQLIGKISQSMSHFQET